MDLNLFIGAVIISVCDIKKVVGCIAQFLCSCSSKFLCPCLELAQVNQGFALACAGAALFAYLEDIGIVAYGQFCTILNIIQIQVKFALCQFGCAVCYRLCLHMDGGIKTVVISGAGIVSKCDFQICAAWNVIGTSRRFRHSQCDLTVSIRNIIGVVADSHLTYQIRICSQIKVSN